MKKYKEWLTNEIEIMESETSENYPHEQMVDREEVLNLIDQIDEPEVKQIKELDSYNDELIRDNNQLRNALDELEVLSQELPVIPKYVAEWIEDLKSNKINLLENIYDCTNYEDINNYMREQGNVLMRAWLDGFTVEEEQKYYVLDSEDIPLIQKTNNHIFKSTTGLNIYEDGRDNSRFEFTEQEIKDYDERYTAFMVPVEEIEK